MTTKRIDITPPFANAVIGAGPGGSIVVVKELSQARISDTTLGNDDELFFFMNPNERWVGRIVLFYEAGLTGDLKLRFDGPTGATGRWGIEGLATGVIIPEGIFTVLTLAINSGTDLPLGGGDVGFNLTGFINFVIQNGATAGNAILLWAQDASEANDTTIQANSHIVANRL